MRMFGWLSRRESAEDSDLGFGSVLASRSAGRLLNPDGSFNTRREGVGFFESLQLYDALLTTTWPRFLGILVATYLGTNAIFAVLYAALGPGALAGGTAASFEERLAESFFFSVQTLSTVGYGTLAPASLAANVLMTAQSVAGLIGIALTTGLVFARFSRPMAKLRFSRVALIAPYRGGRGLMFRLANLKSTQIIELEAEVLFSQMEYDDGRSVRRFYRLPLERSKVTFLPLAWTVVHPIDEDSPLHGASGAECVQREAEILVLLKGIDETFSQTVHSRTSYRAEDLVWNARFTDIFLRTESGSILGVDVSRLSEHQLQDTDTSEVQEQRP